MLEYLLLVFKAAGRTNYSVEAFTFLTQYYYIFSERMHMWNRTVNVHGHLGKNIAGDLLMEHLSRECKGSIGGLGASVTENAITRVGKSLRSSTQILEVFDRECGLKAQSGHHTTRSSLADVTKLLNQIFDSHVFTEHSGRCHCMFPNHQCNIMGKLTKPFLLHWLQERFQKLVTYH